MKNVYIAMPSYSGRPDIETLHCIRNMVDGIQREGWSCQVKFAVGNSVICHARDRFVADMLGRGTFTDLVMIDDDLWWEDDAVLRLLSHDCDVVGGVYPKREDPLTFPVKRFEDERVRVDGLLKVRMLPGGFLRIRAEALRAMTAHYRELAYQDAGVTGGENCALFMPAILPNEETGKTDFWGEDFMFCRRWSDMGGEMFADTLLRFKHIGRKAFEACYFDYLPENRNGD